MKNFLSFLFIVLSGFLVFGDSYQDTTTADFNSAGSVTDNSEVINDSVQLAGKPDWWEPAAGWPLDMSAWQYRKAITVKNTGASPLSDYQVKVENPVYNETGLVGSWHFEETAGTVSGTIADSSGQGYNGTMSGFSGPNGVVSTGKFGNCVSFDGTDDFINIPDSNAWDFGTGNFTISFWFIKTDSATRYALNFGNQTSNNLAFDFNDTGYGVWVFWMSSGTPNVRITNTYNDSNWHFLTFVRSGNVFSLYMDGNYMSSATDSSNIQVNANVQIGARTSGQCWKGSLDEIKIYNRALSADEIQSFYTARCKPNYDDIRFTNSAGIELPYWQEKDGTSWVKVAGSNSIPVGLSSIFMYYGNTSSVSASSSTSTFVRTINGVQTTLHFDEGSGTTVYDKSGNNNNGTFTSSPTWTNGKYGKGIQFDGIDDKITFGTVNRPTDTFSFEAWLSIDSSLTHQIDPEATSGTEGTGGQKYAFWPENAGSSNSESGLSAGTNGLSVYEHASGYMPSLAVYNNTIPAGWNHVVVVYNNKQPLVYLNSALVRTGLTSQRALVYPPATLGGGTYGWYKGIIDEMRVYNNALSQEEISDIFGNYGMTTLGYAGKLFIRKYSSVEPVCTSGSEMTQTSLWQYRKKITVNNSGSALSDYQIKISNPVYDETGLAGSWHLDGATSGTIVNGTPSGMQDSSGNRNNGTASNINGTGMSWTTGKNTGAVMFDGIDDNIDIGNSSTLSMTSAWSLEAWVNPGAVDSQFHEIIRRNGTGGATYLLMLSSTNTFSVNFYDGTAWQAANGTTIPIAGNWYHVVGAWNGSVLAIYVNGILENSGTKTGTPVTPSSNATIGGLTSGRYFNGKIDEVRIYNIELPQSVITGHYASKMGLNYSDLRFTDDSGFELPFWTEKDGSYWIKMSGIPAGSTTFYVYYGNTNAVNPTAKLEDFFDTVDWSAFKTNWKYSGNIANRISGWESQLTLFNYDVSSWSNADISTDYVPETNAARWFVRKEFFIKAGTITYSGVVDDDEVWSLIYGDNAYTKIGGDENDSDGLNAHNWSARAFTVNTDGRYVWAGRGQEGGGGDYFEISSIDSGITSIFTRKTSTSEPVVSTGAEQIPYMTTGSFYSAKKDTAGIDATINSISWTVSDNGTLSMKIRASNSDPTSWETDSNPNWEIVSNGDTSITSTGRYIQYKADFTGSGLTADPILSDVTITYTVPIVPPENSVSCGKLTNTWYSSAVFTFTNDAGFGSEIATYYYAWDNTPTYTFTYTEPNWNASTLPLTATSDGLWYFHFKPYSSTNTSGTVQDLGPYKYDSTAPLPASLLTPGVNAPISSSVASFEWSSVTDLSDVTYTLQIDNYIQFNSPIINKTGLSNTFYTLSGTGNEILIGNTNYYWRIITYDAAGNSSISSYSKFITTASVPQMINESTGEAYPYIQSAIDSNSTVDGDVIDVKDTIAHDENITISKNVIVKNALLAPSSGFAVTGQGLSGGEILRNCIITKGGVSNLALGENLTLFNPDPSATLAIENSRLVNCLIETGVTVTNSILENCYTETTSDYFVNAGTGDFHLTSTAIAAIDKGKNLSAYFSDDIDGNNRGIDILEMNNFDTGAWDIGAYEFSPGSFYLTQPEPETPPEDVTEPAPAEEQVPPSMPELNIPEDGAQNTETSVVLGWYAATGSVSITYTIQWSADQTFTAGVNMLSGIDTIYYTVNGLSNNTTFYWRVKAVNDYGESDWSAVRSFTTKEFPNDILMEQLPPGVPVLIEPLDNYPADVLPLVFRWYPALGTGDTQYHIQVSTGPDFDTVVIDVSGLLENKYELTDDLSDARYYWRVSALNANGSSEWSNIWTFKVTVNASYSGITTGGNTKGGSVNPASVSNEETPAKTCFIKTLK